MGMLPNGRVERSFRLLLDPGLEHRDRIAGKLRLGRQHVALVHRQSDLLAQHSLSSTIAYRQPWGTVGASLGGSQYLDDTSKYRLSTYFNADLRVAKGTSLRLNGAVSSIRDQLSLPREAATDEEILVRQRQLATSYSYYVSIGVSYTFGSIYNTVVNPRFGGGF